jgi:hypothetical protein
MTLLARTLAVAMLLGTALLGVGAAMHPVLAGDAATHLRMIAQSELWRAIHLTMLAGSALVIAGLWVRVLGREPESSTAFVAALAIIAVGEAVNALNTAYMANSGLRLAHAFANGDALAVALYDATHPMGLMYARFGNLLVALGAMVLGAAEWEAESGSYLAAGLAWVAALGGLVGALFFDESSRMILGAVALLSGWQIVTGVRVLRHGTRV